MSPPDPIIVLAARYALALLFATAAIGKFRQMMYFEATLREYELVPGAFVPAVARAVPFVEFGIALAALAATTAVPAMIAAFCVLGVYAFAMGINLARGRSDIDCGCSGPAMRQSLNRWLVLRNVALMGVAACGAFVPAARPLGAADLAVCALAIIAGSVLYAAVNQLTSNVPRIDALDAWMEQPDG